MELTGVSVSSPIKGHPGLPSNRAPVFRRGGRFDDIDMPPSALPSEFNANAIAISIGKVPVSESAKRCVAKRNPSLGDGFQWQRTLPANRSGDATTDVHAKGLPMPRPMNTHIHTYTQTHIHINTQIHIHIYTHTHRCTYTHIHT